MNGDPVIYCSPSKRIRQRPGRVCAAPDCTTVLSIYNPGKICSSCNKVIRETVRVKGK